MLPLLLITLLGLVPQSGVVTHTALLEPAQHTLDLIYNMQFDEALHAAQGIIDLAPELPAAQATEAAFYLGAVYGMQARMHFVERQYIRALLAAKQGSRYLQQCVTRAPDWYDAYAGLGTYAYVLSQVPSFWRGIVQRLVGIAGDRDQGLQFLEQAHTHGRLYLPEDASLLAKIYTLPDERQYDKAYGLLEHLV